MTLALLLISSLILSSPDAGTIQVDLHPRHSQELAKKAATKAQAPSPDAGSTVSDVKIGARRLAFTREMAAYVDLLREKKPEGKIVFKSLLFSAAMSDDADAAILLLEVDGKAVAILSIFTKETGWEPFPAPFLGTT